MAAPTSREPELGAGGALTLLVWLVAMLGLGVLLGADFTAPHQREGGAAAALAAAMIFAVTCGLGLVSLIGAAVHWRRRRHRGLLWMMAGSLALSVVLGGAARGLTSRATRAPGLPPLHAACERGDLEAARALLEDGAPADETDHLHRTPAWYAADAGSLPLLELLAQHGASMRRPGLASAAVGGGDAAMLRWLIARGAPLGVEHGGESTLSAALCRGRADLVPVLLEHDATTGDGRTPIEVAASCGHAELFPLLPHDQRALDDALLGAIDGHSDAMIEPLLALGADPDACNDVDQCAVTLAVFRRSTGTLRALAAHGAHLNARHGLERAWPLQLALEDTWGRDTVVVLLSLGANLPYRDLTADVAARGAEAVADELIASEPF